MRNTIYQDYKIFTGNAHRELAEEISAKLGKSLGKCEVKRFSDGEIAVDINETVRGQDCYIVQPTCNPVNQNLMEILIMIDAMKRAGGQAVFAGHDHVNDWCAELDGIRLVYNQFGGYETYTLGDKTGAPETQWPNGVTITDIAPDGTFDVSRRLHSLYPEDLG